MNTNDSGKINTNFRKKSILISYNSALIFKMGLYLVNL